MSWYEHNGWIYDIKNKKWIHLDPKKVERYKHKFLDILREYARIFSIQDGKEVEIIDATKLELVKE